MVLKESFQNECMILNKLQINQAQFEQSNTLYEAISLFLISYKVLRTW